MCFFYPPYFFNYHLGSNYLWSQVSSVTHFNPHEPWAVKTGIQATSAVVSPSPFIEWILCKQLDVEGNIQWI